MEAAIKKIKVQIKEMNANLRIFKEMEKKQYEVSNNKDYADAIVAQKKAYYSIMDNISKMLDYADLLGCLCGELEPNEYSSVKKSKM